MTRGVLLAWYGGATAVLAIVAALLWPMTAGVVPLPAATSMTLPTSAPPGPVVSPAVVAPAAEIATTDARGRVVRTARTPAPRAPVAAAPAAPAAPPAAGGAPAAAPPQPVVARTEPTTTTTEANPNGGGLLNPGTGGTGG